MELLEENLVFKTTNKIKSCILFLVLFTSCFNNNNSIYLSDVSSIKGELVDHFPQTNSGLLGFYSLLPNSSSKVLNKGKYITVTFEYDKVQKYLKVNFDKIPQYIPDDTCQLVISRIPEFIIENKCICQTLPIPDFVIEIDKYNLLGANFDIEDVEFEKLKLPKDFEYFVEAKKGIFIEDKFLFKDLMMPYCWEHGYSRGYAISKKRNIAIIWLEIW